MSLILTLLLCKQLVNWLVTKLKGCQLPRMSEAKPLGRAGHKLSPISRLLSPIRPSTPPQPDQPAGSDSWVARALIIQLGKPSD